MNYEVIGGALAPAALLVPETPLYILRFIVNPRLLQVHFSKLSPRIVYCQLFTFGTIQNTEMDDQPEINPQTTVIVNI